MSHVHLTLRCAVACRRCQRIGPATDTRHTISDLYDCILMIGRVGVWSRCGVTAQCVSIMSKHIRCQARRRFCFVLDGRMFGLLALSQCLDSPLHTHPVCPQFWTSLAVPEGLCNQPPGVVQESSSLALSATLLPCLRVRRVPTGTCGAAHATASRLSLSDLHRPRSCRSLRLSYRRAPLLPTTMGWPQI